MSSIKKESEHDMELKETEKKTVENVLDRIDQEATRHVKGGFSPLSFSIGVLNCFLIAVMMGGYQQHCWLAFLVELSILYPIRIYNSCHDKPMNTVLYYLDYCWVMNALGIVTLVMLLFDYMTDDVYLSDQVRMAFATTFAGVSCGPLLGATLALPFVAVIFHDVKAMTDVFIHVIPPMVMYTFMWHSQDIREAWPGVFKLDYYDRIEFLPQDRFFIVPGTYLGTVAGNTIALYTVWWILYVSWMLVMGLDLPKKNRTRSDGTLIVPKYDTVYHATVRKGLTVTCGKLLWGRPESVSREQVANNDFEFRDFVVYMTVHAILIYLSVYALAYPCFCSRKIHAAWLIFLVLVCVLRGAVRYTYYVTEMYQKIIRKDYAHLLDDSRSKKE